MNVFTYVLATCDQDVADDLALMSEVCECHIDAALREGYEILRDGLAGFNAYVAWRDMLAPGLAARFT